MSSITERLASAGLELPPVSVPAGAYTPVRACGGLLYVSGQLPMRNGELVFPGVVGDTVSVEQAQEAARWSLLCALSAINAHTPLDAVQQFVQLRGYVCTTNQFVQQSAVIDGASELLVEIFGDIGVHARAAVGVYSLPKGACVELELVCRIAD